MRQILGRYLARRRGDWVWNARVINQSRVTQADLAGGGEKAATVISEAVEVGTDFGGGLQIQFIGQAQIMHSGRMNFQERNGGYGSGSVKNDVVAQANEHVEFYAFVLGGFAAGWDSRRSSEL